MMHRIPMERPPSCDGESVVCSNATPAGPSSPPETDQTFMPDRVADAVGRLLVRSDECPGPAASVLLVDDDTELLALGRRILAAEFPVGTATSAEEALAAIGDTRIGVMVTDLHMPGASGLDLVRETAVRRPDVICILLSGADGVDGAVRAHGLRIYRALRKPIPPRELREVVAHAADVWLLRRRNIELASENASLRHALAPGDDGSDTIAVEPLRRAVAAYERQRIASTLVALNGNKSAAARRLGLTYRGLLLKMQRYGMLPAHHRDREH